MQALVEASGVFFLNQVVSLMRAGGAAFVRDNYPAIFNAGLPVKLPAWPGCDVIAGELRQMGATVLATDMQRVVRIFLRFFFYLSPVLYGLHSVPDQLRAVLVLNPLNGILSLYRGGLFERSVSWVDVGVSVAMSLLFIVVGFWTFSRLERSVLKEI